MHAIKKLVPQSLKNGYHLIQAIGAHIWYGFPSRNMKIIGVTGTDGKTTTSQCIAKIFEHGEYTVALASTINFRIAGKEWVNTSKFTTQNSFATQKFLKKAKDSGCNLVVLEVGSHALDQFRVWGIPFEIGVITNVTREHLDYHKTMARYRAAKKILFSQSKVAVVNGDMENPQEFLDGHFRKKIVYSMQQKDADIYASNVHLSLEGSQFSALKESFSLQLPGAYNIENALAAIGTGCVFGISPKIMAEALKNIAGVPGRMESIPNERGIHILVDYAVTPHALSQVYSLIVQMKENTRSKIIAVFGSCGDRDRGKRPIMGEIVSEQADIVIVTNEDPYYEDPQRIINEIIQGIRNKVENETFFQIMDREKAIRKALELASPGDIVVVTGKGAEETMAIRDERLPWNDRRCIEAVLKETE